MPESLLPVIHYIAQKAELSALQSLTIIEPTDPISKRRMEMLPDTLLEAINEVDDNYILDANNRLQIEAAKRDNDDSDNIDNAISAAVKNALQHLYAPPYEHVQKELEAKASEHVVSK